MRHRALADGHPLGAEALPSNPVSPTPGQGTGGGFQALLEQAAQEILAVTYWFEPAQRPEPYPITVRFVGRRVGVVGKVQPNDQFVHDETIPQVVPGSGPVALTARIWDVHVGEWLVTAHEVGGRAGAGSARATRQERRLRQTHISPAPEPNGPVARFWRRWAPSAAPDTSAATPIRTRTAPFVHVPGTLPIIWVSMVTLGMAVALWLQSLILSRMLTRVHLGVIEGLGARPVWAVSVAAIGVGIIGAKVWFVLKQRSAHRFDGWCIQGFVVGASLTAVILLVVMQMPVGSVLDATAPGLLLGLATGRVGCFFAGCCGGPPTASRWGVWSSDQRVGARRIPTQLMEAALALGLGLGALAELLSHGAAGGAFFVAGLAAYTLGRQGILRLRAEQHKTLWGGWATMAAATLVLAVSVTLLVQCHLQPTA